MKRSSGKRGGGGAPRDFRRASCRNTRNAARESSGNSAEKLRGAESRLVRQPQTDSRERESCSRGRGLPSRCKVAPVSSRPAALLLGAGQALRLPAHRGAASPATPSPMAVCKFGRRARSKRRRRSLCRVTPTSSPVAGCGEEGTQNRISRTPWTLTDDRIHRCGGTHLVGPGCFLQGVSADGAEPPTGGGRAQGSLC